MQQHASSHCATFKLSSYVVFVTKERINNASMWLIIRHQQFGLMVCLVWLQEHFRHTVQHCFTFNCT